MFGQQTEKIPVWATPVQRGGWEGEGEFGDEVCGHIGGSEAWSGESNAADFGFFEVKAVAEEDEHPLDVLIEGADDLLPEEGGAEVGLSFEAARGVGLVEEEADGCMVGWTRVHEYMLANWRDFSIGKLNMVHPTRDPDFREHASRASLPGRNSLLVECPLNGLSLLLQKEHSRFISCP
ncbi:MAG: hypothetical protein GXX96_13670 [Planctomycetaceae bacterium]|jgi:hypothetical protein|nr:hypothetical protein [Planctomycetaceae bacterium]